MNSAETIKYFEKLQCPLATTSPCAPQILLKNKAHRTQDALTLALIYPGTFSLEFLLWWIPMSAMAEEEDFEEIPDSEKTPVTIVTGFLGSGKTTLGRWIEKVDNGGGGMAHPISMQYSLKNI